MLAIRVCVAMIFVFSNLPTLVLAVAPTATLNIPASSASVHAEQSNHALVNANKVNLNTATARELMTVKGINASLARAIIRYRKIHGEFHTIADLKKVRGFNKRVKMSAWQEMQQQVTTH